MTRKRNKKPTGSNTLMSAKGAKMVTALIVLLLVIGAMWMRIFTVASKADDRDELNK